MAVQLNETEVIVSTVKTLASQLGEGTRIRKVFDSGCVNAVLLGEPKAIQAALEFTDPQLGIAGLFGAISAADIYIASGSRSLDVRRLADHVVLLSENAHFVSDSPMKQAVMDVRRALHG